MWRAMTLGVAGGTYPVHRPMFATRSAARARTMHCASAARRWSTETRCLEDAHSWSRAKGHDEYD